MAEVTHEALAAAIHAAGLSTLAANTAATAAMALLAEAPQPKVLWEGGLNELLHAINGTPLMGPVLEAAVAPDDPDAHLVRVALVVVEAPASPAPEAAVREWAARAMDGVPSHDIDEAKARFMAPAPEEPTDAT